MSNINLRRKQHGENERTGDHPYGTGHDPNDRIVCGCAAAYLGFIQVRRKKNDRVRTLYQTKRR